MSNYEESTKVLVTLDQRFYDAFYETVNNITNLFLEYTKHEHTIQLSELMDNKSCKKISTDHNLRIQFVVEDVEALKTTLAGYINKWIRHNILTSQHTTFQNYVGTYIYRAFDTHQKVVYEIPKELKTCSHAIKDTVSSFCPEVYSSIYQSHLDEINNIIKKFIITLNILGIPIKDFKDFSEKSVNSLIAKGRITYLKKY